MTPTKISRFLSLVLRHKPETIGIDLDANGWVNVDTLLEAMAKSGRSVTLSELEAVVRDNDKQRFLIADGRIRANQGHSVNIELGLTPVSPPAMLYHGTASRFLEQIRASGLVKQGRQYVHLSTDAETARLVGARRGQPAILAIDASRMHEDGFSFYVSANGVWLVDNVPWRYLSQTESGHDSR